ncbi:hypothetical protein HJC23_001621 [Cyclotella cryptica]|uniref:Uncharacterized protein n=1 Tax=Cyclotella cryptica TaxID=29204 RepID=A0ABD3QJW1_9STRA
MRPPIISPEMRPVTGAGGLARQQAANASMPTRLVESAGYYSRLLQDKIEEIVIEIERLQIETELADSGSEIRRKLENDYKLALKNIQELEARIADLNLAKDKARSGANHEDVRDQTIDIFNRNKALEREIDEIFVSRKRTESEIMKLETELKRMRDSIKLRFAPEPDRLCEYEMILGEIENINIDGKEEEDKMVDLRAEIKAIEAAVSKSGRRAKARVEDLTRQIQEIESSMELTLVDENEARQRLLNKVKQIQHDIKQHESKSVEVQSEIDALQKEQSRVRSQLRLKSYSPKEGSTALALIRKTDEEQKKYLSGLPEMKAVLEEERKQLTEAVDALREDLDKRITETDLTKLPSKAELELMKNEVAFTAKHLDNNQETITRLQQQKKTRMMELDRINILDDKIREELNVIKSRTNDMNNEMERFKSPEELKDSADATRDYLIETSEKCKQRIQVMDDLLIEVASKCEQKRKTVESNPNCKHLQLLKSKMKDHGQLIFDLREELQQMKATHDYSSIRDECLLLSGKMTDALFGAKQ